MKIKNRITILFTAVVTLILLLLCCSIFYISSINRQDQFRERLKNRALTTVGLLIKVSGINKDLLRRIDEATQISLSQKSVIVYDYNGNALYVYTDENTIPVEATTDILKRVEKGNEYAFHEGKKDIVAIQYNDSNQKYIVLAAAYDKDGYNVLQKLKIALLFSFFSGIIISFLSGIFFSNRLVYPIKKIISDVKEISSQNLSRRIEVKGKTKDELNELSSTFNDLLNRLQESFNMQSRFIANASHELSTPLMSISSQLEITLQKERNTEEYNNVLTSVFEDVQNLTQLTRSLLEIAKASGTSKGSELTMIRVDEIIMKLPSDLRLINPNYFVEMNFENFPDNENLLMVFGNSDLLYSAIKNITINACKYSDNHIANIRLCFFTKELEISIDDNGPGIKKDELDLIFQPFYRGVDAVDNQGFGLGLSLAAKIIQIHKGTLEVQKNSPKGSRFIISIPVANHYVV